VCADNIDICLFADETILGAYAQVMQVFFVVRR
jgi:hypothetical protein